MGRRDTKAFGGCSLVYADHLDKWPQDGGCIIVMWGILPVGAPNGARRPHEGQGVKGSRVWEPSA